MKNDTKQGNWEECPRCGSGRVMVMGKAFIFFLMLTISSTTLILGIIFPPLWIFTLLFLVIAVVALFVPNITRNQCKDCNKSWKPERVEK